MIILLVFAFLAGIATIAAPCILPILPIVLAAGASGGRKRPLGIICGLIVSFSVVTLGLSYLVGRFGVSPDILRYVAILILIIFGLVMVIPKLLTVFEVAISRFLPQSRMRSGDGFWSGILVGFNLGLVWAPCTGPIMASVIALSATRGVGLESVAITLSFVIGAAIPLSIVMYGSRAILNKLKRFSGSKINLQTIFGVIMILTAALMWGRYDQKIQVYLLDQFPGLTQVIQIDNRQSVKDALKKLKKLPAPETKLNTVDSSMANQSDLPVLGTAPEFVGVTHWLNSDPITLASLKGKVVLVDFWTYTCINCIRTLPHVTGWYNAYKDQGFVVVGVHSPEFEIEKKTANVERAIKDFGIKYAVAQDNNFATWTAYDNQYWPAEYLVDASGRVRATHFGEGKYEEMKANIIALLKELNADVKQAKTSLSDQTPPSRDVSPETYLGLARRANFSSEVASDQLTVNHWTISGAWSPSDQAISATGTGSRLLFRFKASQVYLVMSVADGQNATATILLDGKLIGREGGADVSNSQVNIDVDHLYHLVNLGNAASEHTLELRFESGGASAFAFTFG